jgi:hypothetical protein
MPTATRKRGRPHKFKEVCRPVTVTLPESTLDRLATLDADRARAIVKAVAATAPQEEPPPLPEIVEVAPGVSVILVGPFRSLRRIEWLRLMQIAPARYLLMIPSGTSIDSLELAVIDLLENVEADDVGERSALQRLRDLIGTLRRKSELSKAELLLIEKRPA